MIKRFFVVITMMLSICLSSFAVTHSSSKAKLISVINRIVAVVNDDVITQSQLNHQVSIVKKQLQQADRPIPNLHLLKKNILEQMITQKVQLQAAKKTGIRVGNSELNKALRTIAKNNHMDLDQLYASIQNNGISISEYRQQIRNQLTSQKLQAREVASRITITPQEVNDVLKTYQSKVVPEYHLAHILIPIPDNPSPSEIADARKQAKVIVNKLRKGANFQKLAAAKSVYKDALQGSDLGWRKLAELPEVFTPYVRKMMLRSIAGPIQVPNGFHILKLLGVKHKGLKGTVEESEIQLIVLKRSKKDNQKEKALSIYNKIDNGADFGKLAKKYSQDVSAKTGGYVGWVQPGKYPSLVEKAIKKLKPGQFNKPIEIRKAWYLVKVIAKRRIVKSTKAEKREVQEMIFQRKLNEAIQAFTSDLRSQAYIKVFVH